VAPPLPSDPPSHPSLPEALKTPLTLEIIKKSRKSNNVGITVEI